MSRFMLQCACRGARPARAEGRHLRSRPGRVSRLLRDRRRARFLIAPAGFGKAMLAAEYAETVFGFRHVFWISGASPCFLRDLDGGTLGSDLRNVDPLAALAVFADLPPLDEQRAAAFAALVGDLIDSGIEVLVTAVPSADAPPAFDADRVVLDPDALLLDDDELAGGAPLPRAERVACLQWGDEGARTLVEGCAAEELPGDVRAALWAMLAMGRGRRADLRALLGADRADEIWEHLACSYPFLGIDGGEDSFRTAELGCTLVVRAFSGSLEALAHTVGCRSRNDLVCLIADRLVVMGEGERAGRLVVALVPRAAAGAWLGRRGWSLLGVGAAAEVCRLYELSSRAKLEERSAVNAMVACAHGQLGHRGAALDFARKATSATLARPAVKAAAALCAFRQGNASVRTRMADWLRDWLGGRAEEGDAARPPLTGRTDAVLALLAEVALAGKDAENPVALWARRSRPLRERTLDAEEVQGCLAGAAWAVDGAASQGAFERGDEEETRALLPALAELCEWVTSAIEARIGEGAPIGYGAEQAADAIARNGAALTALGLPPLPTAAELAARASQVRRRQAVAAFRSQASVSAPSALLAPAPGSLRGYPLLEVHLFGGVRAAIGGREVSAPLLASRRARTLLALLVLHRGCEVAREDLVVMLWPHSKLSTGRKSFYRLWQTLGNILSVDGACPYLVRDRYGCRLDPALFTSDVMEFEEVVRQLLFGTTGLASGWEHLYDRVRTAFAGELAPTEVSNEVIVEFRERFSLELTDGLIAASCRLRALGEPQGALWFARAALARDESREDAYAALMEAQLSAGQRSGAVATYHACRRHLADSLGLDPSKRLGELYQRVIEEAPLARK